MAKTGTSLIGRADTTLVQGAYKTALSNVGLDMGAVYDQEVKDIKAFGDAISDIIYATNKSNNELFAEIKEGSSEMLANIDAGTYTDDEFIQIYSDAVQDLRNQMKSIPRGREGEAERAKVRAQLARMKVSAENAEDVLTELATFAKEGQLDEFATSNVDAKLFRDIINKTAKRSIVNGELVYTNDEGDTITHNKLKERIIKKDHATATSVIDIFNNVQNYGKTKNAVYDEAYIRKTAQELSSKFNNRAGFLSIINSPIGGMEYSFVQAIASDEELRNELIQAFKAANVDISDKASAEAVIKELRDPNTQNFALVKGIAAQYLAEKGGQIAFDIGARQRPKDDTDETSGMPRFFPPNVQYKGGITSGQLNTYLMKLDAGAINIEGKQMNLQDDGSWLSADGSVSLSGTDIINKLYDSDLGGNNPDKMFDYRRDYRFNKFMTTTKTETTELTPKSNQEIALSKVGADGQTSLYTSIFDMDEGEAETEIKKILGDKYEVFQVSAGFDALGVELKSKPGERIKLVKVKKDANGNYVPDLDENKNLQYTDKRVSVDFRVANRDRKMEELMKLYYTFADPSSKYYDAQMFKDKPVGLTNKEEMPGPTKDN